LEVMREYSRGSLGFWSVVSGVTRSLPYTPSETIIALESPALAAYKVRPFMRTTHKVLPENSGLHTYLAPTSLCNVSKQSLSTYATD